MAYVKCKHCGKKGLYGVYNKKKVKRGYGEGKYKGWELQYVKCKYCGRRSS